MLGSYARRLEVSTFVAAGVAGPRRPPAGDPVGIRRMCPSFIDDAGWSRITRVYLVRHADVENPRRVVCGRLPGWHLSERGRQQGEAVAARLADRLIVQAYASPLERAVETASIVAQGLGVPVLVNEDLTETNVGAGWQGRRWPELRANVRPSSGPISIAPTW